MHDNKMTTLVLNIFTLLKRKGGGPLGLVFWQEGEDFAKKKKQQKKNPSKLLVFLWLELCHMPVTGKVEWNYRVGFNKLDSCPALGLVHLLDQSLRHDFCLLPEQSSLLPRGKGSHQCVFSRSVVSNSLDTRPLWTPAH